MAAPLLSFLRSSHSLRHCRSRRVTHNELAFCRSSSTSVSSANSFVLSNVHEQAGVAILTMNRPPANSLSLEMNEAICTALKDIESNPKIQSVILASSNPTIFSAGLDVMEIMSPDDQRLPRFWNSLQQVYIDLYGSRLAIIAAIQGHSPAAGCMLAMACDYRVMYGGHNESTVDGKKRKNHIPTIGLNETQLGIAAPPWMGQLLVRTIGFRSAERALALGTLFPPMEALIEGLVDDVITEESFSPDADTIATLEKLLPEAIRNQAMSPVMQRAFQEAALYAKISPQARVASKLVTRSESLKEMLASRDEDTEHFCSFICHDTVQKNIKRYVEALKKKSK
ncbi:hypothetical protein ACHAWX_007195 [Stephanocyclus meneghinianus]